MDVRIEKSLILFRLKRWDRFYDFISHHEMVQERLELNGLGHGQPRLHQLAVLMYTQ